MIGIALVLSGILTWQISTDINENLAFEEYWLDIEPDALSILEKFFVYLLNIVQGGPFLSVMILEFIAYFYTFFIEWDVHIFTPKCIAPMV
jgi:hypothetical protein